MSKIIVDALPIGPLQANCYLVRNEGDHRCMVIDPGDDVPSVVKMLEKLSLTPEIIFLTHAHFDHIVGAAHLKKKYNAKIAVSDADSACLYDKSVSIIMPRLNTKFIETHADELVSSGVWTALGMEFTVIATPGHTKGGLCLLNEENRILFSGDTLFANGFGRTDLPGGDWSELLVSLRKLLALDESITVYSGHGDSAAIGEIRKVLFK